MPVPEWIDKFIAYLWKLEPNTAVYCKEVKIVLDLNPPEEEVQQLCDALLRLATSCKSPNQCLFECIVCTVHSEGFSWAMLLTTISQFTKFHKQDSFLIITNILEKNFSYIRCPSTEPDRCSSLSKALIQLSTWMKDGIFKCLSIRAIDVAEALLNVFLLYVNDPFISRIFHLDSLKNSETLHSSLLEPLKQLSKDGDSLLNGFGYERGESFRANLRSLTSQISGLFQSKLYEPPETLRNFMYETRCGLRTVTTVFSCFRVLCKVCEVHNALETFSATLGVSIEEAMSDVIYTSLLMHLEDGDTKASFVEMFIFLKLPKIMAEVAKSHNWNTEKMEGIIYSVLQKGFHILDGFDTCNKGSLNLFLERLINENVVSQKFHDEYINKRPRSFYRQSVSSEKLEQKSLIVAAASAKLGIDKIWHSETKFSHLLSTLIGSGVVAFDAFLSNFCIQGDLVDLSSKLANINRTCEVENKKTLWSATPYNRALYFDLTFTMLYRVSSNYVNLNLLELVNGLDFDNTNGAFFKWMTTMVQRIGQNTTLHVFSAEKKAECREKVAMLKDNRIFWNLETVNYGHLIWEMAIIANIILDKFKAGKHEEDEVLRIIQCLSPYTCLILCMVQWLEGQPHSEARSSMAKAIRAAITDYSPPESIIEKTSVRWHFIRLISQHTLDEMSNGSPVIPPMTYSFLSIAKRSLPAMDRLKIPDKEMLKKGWMFAIRKNWAPQPVLVMIDRCNRAGQHKMWAEFWLHILLKTRTCDDITNASQMICATAMLDPARSFNAICQLLVDFVLKLGDAKEYQNDPPYAISLAKLLTHILVLSTWTVVDGRRRYEESKKNCKDSCEAPQRKRSKRTETIRSSEGETLSFADTEFNVINELDETIKTTLLRMEKAVRCGALSPAVSFVCHVIGQLASQFSHSSVDSLHYQALQTLIRRIPHHLLLYLARLEPFSVPYELFCLFCDPSNEEHEVNKLKLVCLLRNRGAL